MLYLGTKGRDVRRRGGPANGTRAAARADRTASSHKLPQARVDQSLTRCAGRRPGGRTRPPPRTCACPCPWGSCTSAEPTRRAPSRRALRRPEGDREGGREASGACTCAITRVPPHTHAHSRQRDGHPRQQAGRPTPGQPPTTPHHGPLPQYISTSFWSLFGPLQSTVVASPPQQALPRAIPLRFSLLAANSLLRMKCAMFGPYCLLAMKHHVS